MFAHFYYPVSHSIQSFLVPLPSTSYQMLVPTLFQPHPTAWPLWTSNALCCPFSSHTSFLPSPCSTHCSQQPWLLAVWLSFLHWPDSSLFRDGNGERERGRGENRTRNKYVGCQSAIHVQSLPSSPTQNPAQNNLFIFGQRKESPGWWQVT